MAAPIRPASSKAFQREKWSFVPTIALITAPTDDELNAAGALDISCYMFDSSDRPSQNINRVQKNRRVCDGVQYEQLGAETIAGGTLHIAWDPQAAAASNGKKAWEKLVGGTTGFLVRRSGMAYDGDFAAGDFVDVMPIELASPFPTREGADEAAENSFDSGYAITDPPAWNKAVVAAP